MYNKTITIDPTRPDRPLDPLWCLRYAAGRLQISGIPSAMTSAVLVVALSGAATPFVVALDLTGDPAVVELANGLTETVGQGDYWVYGIENTRIYGFGGGKLNVVSAPTLAAQGGVTPVGNTLGIYNPTTGLYHKLIATTLDNGDGTTSVVVSLAQEGTANA